MPTLASFGSGVSFNLWGGKKKKTKKKDGASHTWNQSCSSTCGMVILRSGKTTSIFDIMSFAPSMSDTPWICATKKNHQTTEWTKFQPHKHINFLVSIQFNLIAKITTHTPLSSPHLPPSWLWKPFFKARIKDPILHQPPSKNHKNWAKEATTAIIFLRLHCASILRVK